jgi:hypothetical protein
MASFSSDLMAQKLVSEKGIQIPPNYRLDDSDAEI